MEGEQKTILERAAELALQEEEIRQSTYLRGEKRLRRNIKVLNSVVFIVTVLALLFACLYFIAIANFEARCREQFRKSLERSVDLMKLCQESDFDYDTNYRELTAELGRASQMLFMTKETDDRKKCMNELYFAGVKLPKEIDKYMDKIIEGFEALRREKPETGYSILQTVISELDLLHYGATG